jgi:hypothetical protein
VGVGGQCALQVGAGLGGPLHLIQIHVGDHRVGHQHLPDADLFRLPLGRERGQPDNAQAGYEDGQSGESAEHHPQALLGSVSLAKNLIEECIFER